MSQIFWLKLIELLRVPIDTFSMGMKSLIAILFLPVLGFAQAVAPKVLSNLNASCLACGFTLAPESAIAGQSNVCEDLFGAACLEKDGVSKYQGRAAALPVELNKFIEEARDKTVVQMGFKNFDEALKIKLKEAGLEVKEPVDADAWKNLKKIGNIFVNGGNGKLLYSAAGQCEKESSELRALQYYGETDVNRLTEVANKYESFQKKYREQSIGLYTKDIPNFTNERIQSKCSMFRMNPSVYKPNDNLEVVAACENFAQIKRQAVNLFRMEGTPQYKEQAEKFVRDNMLPELKYASSYLPNLLVQKTEIEKLKEKIQNSSIAVDESCRSFSSAMENAGNKVFEDFVGDVNKAKPTVDSVIGSFYSETDLKLATKVFEESRSDIESIVSQFVSEPSKKNEIIGGYEKLKFFWMEKPADSAYKKNDKGMMILDEDKAAPSYARMFNNDVYKSFDDPSLSFFTSLNADYLPSINMGKINVAERVNMMPAVIKLSQKNPYTFLSMMAHEAGHKIGPEVARINGYDLTPEYRELVACYKDGKSINLQSKQEDEAIADYISSEVLARQISRLPAEKRQQALMSAMEDFCIFEDASAGINCRENHPEAVLRVAGIYGANPNLRKAVGCTSESSKYKSCGLSKISLPSDTVNSAGPKPTSPVKAVQ